MIISAIFYSLSLCAQLTAAIYALRLFMQAKSFRLACGFLFAGLTLMVGRRISPLLHIMDGGPPNLVDAFLSVPISFFLLLGMFQIKKLLTDLDNRNFLLDQSSKVDSLTGAMSRFETFARVELEIKKSFRSKKCIAFLMADIDHFKRVNDRFGHLIGDQVLVDLVNRCQHDLREIDIFGRVGGEEFLIVLPGLDEKSAQEVAERLRSRVASKCSINIGGVDVVVTISIGLVVFDPERDYELDSNVILKNYFDLCDQAMYRAKQAGRNRVCT